MTPQQQQDIAAIAFQYRAGKVTPDELAEAIASMLLDDVKRALAGHIKKLIEGLSVPRGEGT